MLFIFNYLTVHLTNISSITYLAFFFLLLLRKNNKKKKVLGASVVLLFLRWLEFQEAGTQTIGDVIVEIPAIQTDEVANRIRLLIGVVYAVCSLVQFVMIKFVFPLTKEKVAEMNLKLGRTNELKVELNTED